MSLLRKLFGGTSVNYAELIKKGAMIIDVRTPAEYAHGHIPAALSLVIKP